MRLITAILLLAFLFACQKSKFELAEQTDDFFYLRNKGADMPVWVQGNTASKTFVLMLHGGPGGSSMVIDEFFPQFINPLESAYGVIYWDQRSAGSTQGNYDESTLTLENYVEDLEKLIVLIKDKYGQDINLFLAGISWGGYLGTAYLTKDNNQDNIKGWINIVGTNSFNSIANIGKEKLIFYANQQLEFGKNKSEWEEIKSWTEQQDTITSKDDFVKVNAYAAQAESLLEDSIQTTTGAASLGDQLSFVFSSPFSANAWLSNRKGIINSQLIDTLMEKNIDTESIKIPSILFGGKYDFIVPQEVLRDQFDRMQAEDKSLHIFPNSGHGLIGQEVETLNFLITDFIEQHK